MFGFISKILIIFITIMITLNIFVPTQAKKVVNYFSESTNIEEGKIQKNLDLATKFTQDTFEEVSEKVKKHLSSE
ncbi:hypothetical protein ALC152_01030 [Arcobacter sp. 15-2]|uniref:hypothetical protein n=1 Tax=Arcobacter sp. 15-2 TaxID=3374109 RepID=UPI00399CC05B